MEEAEETQFSLENLVVRMDPWLRSTAGTARMYCSAAADMYSQCLDVARLLELAFLRLFGGYCAGLDTKIELRDCWSLSVEECGPQSHCRGHGDTWFGEMEGRILDLYCRLRP